MKYFILLIAAIFPVFFSFGQTKKIDNLKKDIYFSANETEKLNASLTLCEQGNNLHGDTLLHYATIAFNTATKLKDRKKSIVANYFQCYALTNKGLIDTSLQIADDCLAQLKNENADLSLEAKLYNQKGRCYMRKNQYKEAIDMGYKVINTSEKAKDTLIQMQGETLIGWAYLEMGRTSEALKWHLQAMRATTNRQMLEKYSILFANIGLNYNALGMADSAFYYVDKAVVYSRENENLFGLSNSLAIQAQFFVRAGKPAKAAANLEEVVDIRKSIGDPFYIVSDMAQLAIYYASNSQTDKGIATANEGIAIANKFKIGTKLSFLYAALAENYKAMNNHSMYSATLEKIIRIKDSVFQNNSAQSLAEMQAKYELQKKENTIIQQKLNITRKDYLFYGSLLFTLLIIGASLALFNSYKKRQKLKTQKMLEDRKRNEAEAIRQAQEKERQRIAADLHDNLGVYAASMASNLDYIALQDANTKSKEAYIELKNNSQSIISQLNDTIWVLKRDSLSLTSISDRIKVFANRVQPSYPHVNIEVDESVDNDLLLPSSQAFHLYRIVQEAVINSLKHSNCSRVIIKINSTGIWNVTVADNGNGMPVVANGQKEGNGIANLKNRCKEEGWLINWISNGLGTTVMVSPTTN